MRAACITGHGGNEVVRVGECSDPRRSRGEVLVRIHAAGLNRVDLYMRNSGNGITHRLPQIMGVDGAGTIVEIDDDERRLSVNQHVVLHPGLGFPKLALRLPGCVVTGLVCHPLDKPSCADVS